jgi:hypothetical protein
VLKQNSETITLTAYLNKLGEELINCYLHFAYIDGLREFASKFPKALNDSLVWSDLYRSNAHQLLLAISRCEDNQRNALSIKTVFKIASTNVATIQWKRANSAMTISGALPQLQSDFGKLPSCSAIQSLRNHALVHNDPRIALGTHTLANIPYADLKEHVKFFDEMLNVFWLELEDKTVKYDFVYEQTLMNLNYLVKASIVAYNLRNQEFVQYSNLHNAINLDLSALQF